MIDKLKPNERLVYAGKVALRAPDGTRRHAVPQFMIVPEEQADPKRIVELQDDERLVEVGTVHNDKKRAEQRFAELKAGRKPARGNTGIPLYVKTDAANVNPKSGLSTSEEKACDMIIGELAKIFQAQMKELEEIERQRA